MHRAYDTVFFDYLGIYSYYATKMVFVSFYFIKLFANSEIFTIFAPKSN